MQARPVAVETTLVIQDLVPIPLSLVDIGFSQSGVYFLFRGDVVVYVGQSSNVLTRIGEHISDRFKLFDGVAFIKCDCLNRLWLEKLYIDHFKPEYNGAPSQPLFVEQKPRRERRLQRSQRRRLRLEKSL